MLVVFVWLEQVIPIMVQAWQRGLSDGFGESSKKSLVHLFLSDD